MDNEIINVGSPRPVKIQEQVEWLSDVTMEIRALHIRVNRRRKRYPELAAVVWNAGVAARELYMRECEKGYNREL